jgi:hypothetical protein
MEWNDIGIKEAEDILTCLRKGATAFDLYDAYGSRIAGLIADACDQLQKENIEMRALALALYQECQGDRVEGTWEELMKRAKTELSKAGVSCD